MRGSHAIALTLTVIAAVPAPAAAAPPGPATFSIVAADPDSGELGVAVASRFFAVGAVVPFARAGVGAGATQAYANTSYGPTALELMAHGVSPAEAITIMTRSDEGRDTRQLGLVTAKGEAETYSGSKCNAWAGGRRGPGYAVQGNILAGEAVVAAMEKAFLESRGKRLVERLYAALAAGDKAGGDSRGKQSAAVLVVRERGGYGGFDDVAIDVRVDDHTQPIVELGRLVAIGLALDDWNRAWSLFGDKKFAEALPWQERAVAAAAKHPSIEPEVTYDLAVIRLAAGDKDGAWKALQRALKLNPKLAAQADKDPDLEALRPFPKK